MLITVVIISETGKTSQKQKAISFLDKNINTISKGITKTINRNKEMITGFITDELPSYRY